MAVHDCISGEGQTAMTLENMERSLKRCNNCSQWFEKTTFPPGRGRCRKCHRQFQSISIWKSTLKHKYGITPEIHQMMYEDQGGRCYFCDDRPTSGKVGLAIDHDKDTGLVRGLLCRPCNANFIDEYRKLPEECRNFPRANDYLRRGETGHYVEGIKQRLASDDR